jgi:dihydropteroate synthase
MRLFSRNSSLDLSQTHIMGILNITADSFSDGSFFLDKNKALVHAHKMIREGSSIIDVGGESTRPGAVPVSLQEELDRVIPIIEHLTANEPVWVSVDTSKTDVMHEAAKAGAHLINDVSALQANNALTVAAQTKLAVCLMHMQGEPQTMQVAPTYNDVVSEISVFFEQRIKRCLSSGIETKRLLLDPGFGFGKSMAHNYTLLAELKQLQCHNLPILVGLSRKSMISNITGNDINQRLVGSVTAAIIALMNGAKIVRVHDVQETANAIKIMTAMQNHTKDDNYEYA